MFGLGRRLQAGPRMPMEYHATGLAGGSRGRIRWGVFVSWHALRRRIPVVARHGQPSYQIMYTTASILTVAILCTIVHGQSTAPAESTEPRGGIAWFGTWERGKAEAKRTGRPILLISAAPHCRQIPGMW